MPIYVAKCVKCGSQVDYFRPLSKYKETPSCCSEPMTKVITPVFVPQEYSSVVSPIDGKWIHGREQYFAHCKEHNVIPKSDTDGMPKAQDESGKGLKEDIAKTIQQLGG